MLPHPSLSKRFDEFRKRVQPTALYGAGAWTWSCSLCNETYSWENSLLRRMTRIRRRSDEDLAKHLIRATRTTRVLFHREGRLSLATKVLDSLHRLAGTSFARLCIFTSWSEQASDNYEALGDTVCVLAVIVHIPSQCFLPACVL